MSADTGAKASLFRVKIISPERVVWEGEARVVTFRTLEGSMGVLNKRAPIIVALDIAPLKVSTETAVEEFAVHGGVLKMDGDTLVIITDAAENVREIDVYRAEMAKKRAMDRLEKAKSDIERVRSKASIQKNLLRETLASKR